MTDESISLLGLIIDDDQDDLNYLEELLPKKAADCEVEWEPCLGFEKAERLLKYKHYDIIVLDLLVGDPADGNARGLGTLSRVKELQFCPVVSVSVGDKPEGLTVTPFVSFSPKKDQAQINKAVEKFIKTGIPPIARKLHQELFGTSSQFLWEFLEKDWEKLVESENAEPAVLERLIRSRAAFQLRYLTSTETGMAEIGEIDGPECYIYPPIKPEEFRFGDIIRHKTRPQDIRLIITPRCHLVTRGEKGRAAKRIMTIKTRAAKVLLRAFKLSGNTKQKRLKNLSRKLRSPAEDLGRPRGRFCFLPKFLEIDDRFCDFQSIETILYEKLKSEYDSIATLDTPFSEAIQSSLARYYTSVGLPELRIERYTDYA